MILNHDAPKYRERWDRAGYNRYNGAYYYSVEINENIIPRVKTDRNWVTINQPGLATDHAIIFIHNNLHPQRYEWLRTYNDLVLVCGVPDTIRKIEHLGKAIYLPLSVDVDYVKQFAVENKTKGAAFAGRPSKENYGRLPYGIDKITRLERELLLPSMAQYEIIYAVGRTAIEAKILGCEVRPYDRRYPDPEIWRVFDNKDAAAMLQLMIDKIDGVRRG